MKKSTSSSLRLDRHYLLCSAAAAGVAVTITPGSKAAVVYSGLQNIPIFPLSANGGVYIDVESPFGASQGPAQVSGWDLNPYANGGVIYTAGNTRVVINGGNAANLPSGDVVSSGSVFSSGGFYGQLEIPPQSAGYIGFSFDPQSVPGVQTWYGWMQIASNPGGNGTVVNWAYDNTGAPIVIPEPGPLAMLAMGFAGVTMRRRRRVL